MKVKNDVSVNEEKWIEIGNVFEEYIYIFFFLFGFLRFRIVARTFSINNSDMEHFLCLSLSTRYFEIYFLIHPWQDQENQEWFSKI